MRIEIRLHGILLRAVRDPQDARCDRRAPVEFDCLFPLQQLLYGRD